MTFTTAEKLENVIRTIVASTATIERLEAELADMRNAHRANLREQSNLTRQLRLETSPKARWDRAIKSLRKDGVHFRTNIMQCCRGCVDATKLNLKDESQAYGWTFGGQGSWIKFNEDGLPFTHSERRYEDYETPTTAYVNWGNGAGETIAAAFRAEGFQVEFDGNESSCVEIKF